MINASDRCFRAPVLYFMVLNSMYHLIVPYGPIRNTVKKMWSSRSVLPTCLPTFDFHSCCLFIIAHPHLQLTPQAPSNPILHNPSIMRCQVTLIANQISSRSVLQPSTSYSGTNHCCDRAHASNCHYLSRRTYTWHNAVTRHEQISVNHGMQIPNSNDYLLIPHSPSHSFFTLSHNRNQTRLLDTTDDHLSKYFWLKEPNEFNEFKCSPSCL